MSTINRIFGAVANSISSGARVASSAASSNTQAPAANSSADSVNISREAREAPSSSTHNIREMFRDEVEISGNPSSQRSNSAPSRPATMPSTGLPYGQEWRGDLIAPEPRLRR